MQTLTVAFAFVNTDSVHREKYPKFFSLITAVYLFVF